MSRKAKFTPEEKEQAVIDYLEGNKSRIQICGELCISSRTIQCTFRINGAPFPRQRCKRLAPAVRYPFVVTC